MKTPTLGNCALALGMLVLAIGTGCVQQAVSSPDQTNNVTTNTLNSSSNAVTAAALSTSTPASTNAIDAEDVEVPEVDIAEADFKPIDTPKPAPPGIRTNGPLGEIMRMADSGVEEGILLAFVTNSTSTFNLNADEIIYLNDIGIPSEVVTAMIQRDQVLRSAGSTNTNVWAEAEAQQAPAQDPAQIAPQSTAPETAQAPPPPAGGAQPVPQQPQGNVTYNTFYNSLSPYGNWVHIEGYGNVWQPAVVVSNPTWTPYLHGGRWVYSDYGWYWVSDYSWGWAPFHYGRWFRHYRLGWCWYPDYVWGPSWVTWRYTDGYCGWAPLPPGAWWRPGIGLTWWGSHVGVSFGFGLGYHSFSFVSWGHFRHHRLHHHRLHHHDHVRRVYTDSVIATRIHGNRRHAINDGLPVSRVAAATGTPVQRVRVQETSNLAERGLRNERLGNDGKVVKVYRPTIAEANRPAGGTPMRGVSSIREPGRTSPSATTVTRSGATATRDSIANRSIPANRLAGGAARPYGTPTDSATPTTPNNREWQRPVPAAAPSRVVRTPVTAANPAQSRATATSNPGAVGGRLEGNRSAFSPNSIRSQDFARTDRVAPTTTTQQGQATAPSAPSATVAPPSQAARPAPGTSTVWQRQNQLQTQPNATQQSRTPPIARFPQRQENPAATPAPATPPANSSIWQRQATPQQSPTTRQAVPQVQAPQQAPRQAYPGSGSSSPMIRPEPLRSQTPQTYQAPSQPRFEAPRYTPAPQPQIQRPAPAPSYSAPSFSAPQRSAPSPSFSAPQRSAPAPSFTPPAPRSSAAQSFSAPAPSMQRSSPAGGGGGGGDRSGFSRPSRNDR